MPNQYSHMSEEERWFSKFECRGPDECWPWKACTNEDGYGTIWDKSRKKVIKAHRMAYERQYGLIPDGKVVLHVCDSPSCVNHRHLKLGTQADNIYDMVAKNRHMKGEQQYKARLDPNKVRDIRRKLADGRPVSDIAREYQIASVAIYNIKRNITWKHVA